MSGQERHVKEKLAQKAEEARHISRLREEQERAIQQTKERVDLLQKYKDDYIALKDRLVTLPDKVSHDVMVPFGKLAFMPGKLVHTNEVLVLLGDNWFAEMSAKQAGHTVERRVAVLDEQMTELKKQGGLLEPRLEFTSHLQDMAEARGDLVEIKEEYDEEKEKAWREQHRKNVAAYNKERKEKDLEEGGAGRDHVDRKQEVTPDSAVWERLARLEQLEEEAGEMDSSSSGSEESSDEEEAEASNSRKIRWQDEGPKPRDRNKTIYFSHTQTESSSICTHGLEPKSSSQSEQFSETSGPGDISTHCRGQGPKSILKPSTACPQSSTQTSNTRLQGGAGNREIQETGTEAFSGSVVEKPVTLLVDQPETLSTENTSTQSSTENTSTQVHIGTQPHTDTQATCTEANANAGVTTTQPQRPVSRFKAQRMSRK